MKRPSKSKGCVAVLVTCPNRASAKKLADALIGRKLAACVNILPEVQSVFRWKGKTERAAECLLIIKAAHGRLLALQRAVIAIHPYDVPEIIALPIVAGYRPYLNWVRQSCRDGG